MLILIFMPERPFKQDGLGLMNAPMFIGKLTLYNIY